MYHKIDPSSWRRQIAATAPDGMRWVLEGRVRTDELLARPAASGYRGRVLSVGDPVSGLRLREWRIRVHLPDDLALPNLAGDSTLSAREEGSMALVTRECEPVLTPDEL